jgi:MFS family permease
MGNHAVNRWKLNLAVLSFGQFLVMGGMTMVIPFLPLYIQEMGVDNVEDAAIWAGVIFAGNFVTSFGGLLPSVHSLIRQFTPNGMESRAYSLNTSALSLGNLSGPIIGGLLAGWITIRGIFVVAAVLLLCNALWVRIALVRKAREVRNHQ